VVVGAGDKQSELLGAGAIEPTIAEISFGTATAMHVLTKKYINDKGMRFFTWPAAIPNAWDIEMFIHRGFWMVTWFKQEFGLREERLAAEKGVEPETFFDELVRSVPPGSEGLVLQPYWSPGLVFPGPEARGAVIGFSDVHTRAHLYRAILEGLAYALREGAERTAKRSGVAVTELRVAGGGSQSEAAMQLTADVFGLPASRPHVYEASGLGAAMDAAVGAGVQPDFPSAIRDMTRVRDTFEPDPQAHARYEELYNEVYKKMYKQLKSFYQVMRKK
jgi:sugar (pentulose or hexulose) kinase